MAIMALGQFVFTLSDLAFNELQRQRQWNYAENAVATGRAKKQYIGQGEENITLNGNIYQEHGMGKRESLDELATMADSGQGYTLVDGSGYIYGVYIITGLDETKSFLIEVGVPRKIDFSLKLVRVDDDKISMQN